MGIGLILLLGLISLLGTMSFEGFARVMASLALLNGTKDVQKGNISVASASGLSQWQDLGRTYHSSVTFSRDDTGDQTLSGNFTFSIPEDGYNTSPVSFTSWNRSSNLTINFDYTLPADGYAGVSSPEFRLDFEGGKSETFDYQNVTGRYLFTRFNITDPEPADDDLGNDDLSTLVPPAGNDPRFTSRIDDAYNNSLNASRALTMGERPYRTKDLYGAMKNMTAFVNGQMTSDSEWESDQYYGDFTQSDWYIGYNTTGFGPRYHGVCKDYVSLARSYSRSMGIPARVILSIANDQNDTLQGHDWMEVYDGSRWIHSDPTWNLFDDPWFYKNSGLTDIRIRELSIAHKQGKGMKISSPNDDLLFQAWVFWGTKDRVDFDIVTDRGTDPMYN